MQRALPGLDLDPREAPARALALEVHARLCGAYGCPVAFFHHHDPVSELVSAMLSHRTRNADSGAAFRALRAAYPQWELLRDAPVEEVMAHIARCSWPERKAPAIQSALRAITERRGALSLEHLRGTDVESARAWLAALPGVGPKTAAAVLLFSDLRMRAMPVDSHHHRVASRLALLPAGTSEARAHVLLERLLPASWDAQALYDHHEVMMFHGQRRCFHDAPDCARCELLDLCPTGRGRVAR